ncbi:MAG TPA: HNH endonuclease signature motif containing protein [Allocoleopsis sp.]
MKKRIRNKKLDTLGLIHYIHEMYEYKKEGLFILKKNTKNNLYKAGYVIKGRIDKKGYRIININDWSYKYHRIVFLYHKGYFPKFIDHVNRDKTDCRIENLRECTLSQNMANRLNETKKSTKGFSWHKNHNKYISRIRVNNKLIHLGYFNCPLAAKLAYNIAADKSFGEFACY